MQSHHTHSLLADVERFLSETGMGPTYFGKLAANNTELVNRLRDGRRVWPETEAMVRDFMAIHIASKRGAA